MSPHQQELSTWAITPRLRDAARKLATAAMLFGVASSSSWAAGSGMPWEAPLQRILDSVQGPVAISFID